MAAATASSAATPSPAITSRSARSARRAKAAPASLEVTDDPRIHRATVDMGRPTLEAAKSFAQHDTTLTLFDASGDKLAQFVRADAE